MASRDANKEMARSLVPEIGFAAPQDPMGPLNTIQLQQALKAVEGVTMWAQRQEQNLDYSERCLRKTVGCTILVPSFMVTNSMPGGEYRNDILQPLCLARNGPPKAGACTNEKGNCGCIHAEPKAVMFALNTLNRNHMMVMCSTYSPCLRCAAIIAFSGIITHYVWYYETKHDQGWTHLAEHNIHCYDLQSMGHKLRVPEYK